MPKCIDEVKLSNRAWKPLHCCMAEQINVLINHECHEPSTAINEIDRIAKIRGPECIERS